MSNILAILANVSVSNLDASIPFYRQLTGAETIKRFSYKHLQVASVGPFLLIEGSLEGTLAQEATVVVRSVDLVLAVMKSAGGELLEGPDDIPNGTRIVMRHPDGAVFEYIQPAPPSA